MVEIGEKKVEIGGKKGIGKKNQTVLEHKQVTKLFTLYCSAIILMSQASFWGRKALFQSWWSHTGGINIPRDEILWPEKQLGVTGFLF